MNHDHNSGTCFDQDFEEYLVIGKFLGKRAFYIGLMFEEAAQRHGTVAVTIDRPLDVFGDPCLTFTFADLAEKVADLSSRLWAAGVRPSEHVVIHKSPNVDIALLACAAARIGAVPVMVSPALDGAIVAKLLDRLKQPWLVTDDAKLGGPLAGIGLPELIRKVLSTSANGEFGATPLVDLAGAPRRDPIRMHRREPALITHTSGTTGVPKLMVHCAEAIWHRLMPQRAIAWSVRKKETVALCMSFVHSRFYHSLGVFLHFGNPLAILVDPDPDSIAPLFRKIRPGVVETHPNNFIQWEDLVHYPGGPLKSIRYYSSTFDAIHPRTMQQLLEASTRRRPLLIQLYGQSETGPISGWFYTARSSANNARCVGLPLPGFIKVRVVDEEGKPVPTGTAGHLEVRGYGRALTYLGEDERYARQLNDGWWRLGDMGYLSRWGLLYLIDREIDQIDSVASTLEIEDTVMARLDELVELIIVPSLEGHPLPIVCTRRDQPLDLTRWQWATQDLPPMEEPLQWRFNDLPRTSTWKVRRVEIIQMIKENLHRPYLVGNDGVPA